MSTKGNVAYDIHSDTNRQLTLHKMHLSDLQTQLRAEQDAKNMLQAERDDYITKTQSLSTQLTSACNRLEILREESYIDKEELNELHERVQDQTQLTLEAQTQINIIRKLTDNEDTKTEENINANKHNIKYQKEIRKLQQMLMDKNTKIESLSNLLDTIKTHNNSVQNETIKSQQMQKQLESAHHTMADHSQIIQRFEKENNELLHLNQQLTQERYELIQQMHMDDNEISEHDTNDTIPAPYEYTDLRRLRSMSIVSNQSHFYGLPLIYTSNTNDNTHMQHDIETLNKDELISVINECKERLETLNVNHKNNDVMIHNIANKTRFSDTELSEEHDDGYLEDEEKEKVMNTTRTISNDIDNHDDDDSEAIHYIAATGVNHVDNDNDDEEEKLIQQDRSNCNIGTNALLIVQKIWQNLPFVNT